MTMPETLTMILRNGWLLSQLDAFSSLKTLSLTEINLLLASLLRKAAERWRSL